MARKKFTRLHVTDTGGRVAISFFKSTRYFAAEAGKANAVPVRIYRKKEADFKFGLDFEEYFDGLDHRAADCIFNGTLESGSLRKLEYVDREVEPRSVYAYWVAGADETVPAGPCPVKVRDRQVWPDQETITAAMQDLQKRYPDRVEMRTIGATILGNPIPALVAGNANNGIALLGAIHGAEQGYKCILPVVEALLAQSSDLLDTTGIAAVPVVNIDERNRIVAGTPWYLRKNANGVDINRNFDADWKDEECRYGQSNLDARSNTYRGQAPASEPETRAVTAFFEQIRPRAVFSYHCLPEDDADTLFFPTRHAVGDQAYASSCQELASLFSGRFSGREMKPEQIRFVSASGSLPHWVYAKLRVPAFDMECFLPPGRNSFDVLRRDDVDAACVGRYVQRSVTAIEEVLRKLA